MGGFGGGAQNASLNVCLISLPVDVLNVESRIAFVDIPVHCLGHCCGSDAKVCDVWMCSVKSCVDEQTLNVSGIVPLGTTFPTLTETH